MRKLDTILQGAVSLHLNGQETFSEWDLTIAAWQLDRRALGMRGYEELYPDHKRVAMDLMAHCRRDRSRDSRHNGKAIFERVGKNRYRLCDGGWWRLWPEKARWLLNSWSFSRWSENPAEPAEASVVIGDLRSCEFASLDQARGVIEPIPVYGKTAQVKAEILDWILAMKRRFGDKI